jgi:hypothetical protein
MGLKEEASPLQASAPAPQQTKISLGESEMDQRIGKTKLLSNCPTGNYKVGKDWKWRQGMWTREEEALSPRNVAKTGDILLGVMSWEPGGKSHHTSASSDARLQQKVWSSPWAGLWFISILKKWLMEAQTNNSNHLWLFPPRKCLRQDTGSCKIYKDYHQSHSCWALHQISEWRKILTVS